MEFWQSAPDELPPPPLPPPPPQMWLQRSGTEFHPSVSDQPPPPPKPLTETELRQSSPDQPSYGQLETREAEGILLEEKEVMMESKGMDMSSLEPKIKEVTEQEEKIYIQDGTGATSAEAKVSWSPWWSTLSQAGRALNTVKGILKIVTPVKSDISKDQPIASEITSDDILKKPESISVPPIGSIITRSTLGSDGSMLQSAENCTNPRYGLGNDYLNQGIGYSVEYIRQGIGRANENNEMLNNAHPNIERDTEKETINRFGIGCNVQYYGQGTRRANGDVDMFNNVDPDIQRVLEKQKIREEIIAAEMARRLELEAEVREELRRERELALRNKKKGNAFDSVRVPVEPRGKSLMQEVEGLSLEKDIAMSVEESLRIQGRTETLGMDVLPFQQTSLESKVNETVQEKEKNIFLAKPSADLSTTEKDDLVPAKESAYTVFGVWGVGNIEGKKVWRCFICQVSAASEAALKQHFTGNEHRSKRAVLKAEKSAVLKAEKSAATTGESVQISSVPMEPRGKSLMQEVEGLSLEDNIAMSVEESLRIQGRTETSGMDMFPFQRMNLESKVNETVHEKEKKIFLAKPSAERSTTEKEDLVRAKESACTVFNAWGVGNIEGKKVWICFLCQVNATSEADLKHHFTGIKHRSKRDALLAEKIAVTKKLQIGEKAVGLSQCDQPLSPVELKAEKSAVITEEAVKISRIEPLMPVPPPVATAKPLDCHVNESVLPEKKNKAKGKEKFAFWCEMCNTGANNKYVMEAHKKGKKHLGRLQKKLPFWCDLCKVGAERAHIMEAHLKGKKHLTTLQEKAAGATSEQGNLQTNIF